MGKLVALSLFSLISPAFSLSTYWVDQSCTNGNFPFFTVLQDAQDIAQRGNTRMQSQTDTDQAVLFDKLFKTPKTNQNAFTRVNQVLGSSGPGGTGWGVAGMVQVQNNDRSQANVRYYCDNDPQNVNGNSRWTLRPDPNPAPPGYIPQRFRPRFNPDRPEDDHQEWEDVLNGILMGDSNGCLEPGSLAETFYIERPGTQGQAIPRVTITICDTQMRSALHSFNDLPAKKDISTLINPVPGQSQIDAFKALSSFVVLHEAMHVQEWFVADAVSPDNPDDGAYSWSDAMNIFTSADALNNVQNYVFFAFLAKLADRHFRLSRVENEAIDGKLVYDRHGITSRLLKGRSWDEFIGGGLVRRWWSA